MTWRRTVAGTVMTLAGTTAGLVNSTRTLLGDQIGSVDAVADLSSGGLVERADYAAFGAMRTALSAVVVGVAPLTTTTRGFTGQEQLATLDLVHLNGRIYDPQLGRFLQADPMVAQPYNPQNWNPYSYVFNNPLANTDPTGMFSIRQALGVIISIVFAVITQDYLQAGQMLAAFLSSAAGGFLSGVVSTGSLKQGVIGAFEAGLTLGIGGSGWNTLEQIGANAVTGGVISVLSGGKFGNGFVSAGLTCAAMPLAGNSGNVVVRSVEGALIGGTISEATGGKFANGAISGAVQGAMEEPRDLENEKQKGANADLSDDAVTRLEKEVRANFSDGKAYASAQLTAFCAAKNSGCGADTGTAAGFDATKFTWSPKHFFGNEDKASVQFTGATTDPDTKQITLYDGGIALQGNGTGKQAVAMILLHEYRHTTPFNIREWQQYKATPAYINNDVYMQRPNEIDAFAWSKKVMDYVPSH